LALHLGPEPFLVDAGECVAGAVHPPGSGTPTYDRDKLVRLVVVVSREKLGQRLVWGATAEEGDHVLSVAPPLVLANRLAESDVNGAFGARRTDEDAVPRV